MIHDFKALDRIGGCMAQATNDGVSIHYRREGSGEAVVFLQGLGYGRWMWRWQRDAVTPNYQAILPDNRGTGRSDTPGIPGLVRKLPGKLRRPLLALRFGYTIEDMAADLEAVLADAGVRNVHLVGASMGGMIALQYALEYRRASSLTLVATTPGGELAAPIPEETRDVIFDVPAEANERETIRHRMRPAFNDRFTNRNPHLMDQIIEWRLEQDADDVAREAQAIGASAFDVADQLGRISQPTLIIHGTDDRVVPVDNGRLLHQRLPDNRLELIDGGSHLVFIEDADRVNTLLLDFLDAKSETQERTSSV